MKTTLLCMLGLFLFVALRAPAEERPSSSPTSAAVVKTVTFVNQTGAIPETTIFTPTADGFFRANIFGEVVVTNAGNPSSLDVNSSFCPVLSFIADSGAIQTGGGVTGTDYFNTCVPVIGTLTNSSAPAVYFFRAKANLPITFSTIALDGPPPVAPFAYTVYIVLERF